MTISRQLQTRRGHDARKRRTAGRRLLAAVTVCAIGCGTLTSAAQASAPDTNTTGPRQAHSRAAALQHATAAMVANGQPGAIALTRIGRQRIAAASGVADKATAAPMRPIDRVHIGSITKTFVSTVALQLVGEHRLSLDDTLADLSPGELAGTSYNPSRITLRELLQHTSGIRDYLTDPRFQTTAGLRRVWKPQQLVDIAAAQGTPLHGWNYSNTNYIIVGMIIERVTHHSLAEELRRRIIAPLHLRHTSFPFTDTTIPGPHAHGYFGKLGDVTTLVNPSAAGAAGAMISNAGDVTRFLSALLGGRVLHPAQLRQMTTTIAVHDTGLFDERYGLGIYSVRLPCGTEWGHDGGYPGGFRTYAFTNTHGTRAGAVIDNDFGVSDQPDNPRFRTAVQHAVRKAAC